MARSVRLLPKWRSEAQKIYQEKYKTQESLKESLKIKSSSTVNRFFTGKTVEYPIANKIFTALGWEKQWQDKCIDGDISNNMLTSPHTEKFENYINGKLRRFAGRKHIYTEFKEYRKKYDRGYFLLLADPGEGKSTIAAQFVKKNDCVYYFNARRKGWTSAETFLETICNQLIEYGGLESQFPPPNLNTTGDLLLKLLNRISERLGQSEKLIVVVDALDEVNLNSQEENSTILYLPDTAELPKNVFFLLTSRRDKEIKLPFGIPEDGIVDLKNRKPNCNDDIKEYLQKTFDDKQDGKILRIWLNKFSYKIQDFVDDIVEISQRNFMYLTLVLPEIIKGTYDNRKPKKLPKGLIEYYDDHFDRMIKLLKKNGRGLSRVNILVGYF